MYVWEGISLWTALHRMYICEGQRLRTALSLMPNEEPPLSTLLRKFCSVRTSFAQSSCSSFVTLHSSGLALDRPRVGALCELHVDAPVLPAVKDVLTDMAQTYNGEVWSSQNRRHRLRHTYAEPDPSWRIK